MSRFERQGEVLVDVDDKTHTIILDSDCAGWHDVDHSGWLERWTPADPAQWRSEPITIADVIERIGMSSMEVSWALQAECDLRYEAERREAEGIEEWDPERARYISEDLWDPEGWTTTCR